MVLENYKLGLEMRLILHVIYEMGLLFYLTILNGLIMC